MRVSLAAALFALPLVGMVLLAGPRTAAAAAAAAETVTAAAPRAGGEIQLAQILRERGASNRYKERLRRHLFRGQHGDAYALRQIGFYYAKGWGVIRDLSKAYMWFSLAAREGNADAGANLDTIAASLSTADIARAEAMAERWLETHEWEIEAGSFGG